MIRKFTIFGFFIFLISNVVSAGLFEGINLFEQKKYKEAFSELYPLKGVNLYAHPYILDLYQNHSEEIMQFGIVYSDEDLQFLKETLSEITCGNLEASKLYIQVMDWVSLLSTLSKKQKNYRNQIEMQKDDFVKKITDICELKCFRAEYILATLRESGYAKIATCKSKKIFELGKTIIVNDNLFKASFYGDMDALFRFLNNYQTMEESSKAVLLKTLSSFLSKNNLIFESVLNNLKYIALKYKNDNNLIGDSFLFLSNILKNKNFSLSIDYLFKAVLFGSNEGMKELSKLLEFNVDSFMEDKFFMDLIYFYELNDKNQCIAREFTKSQSNLLLSLLHTMAYNNFPERQCQLARLYNKEEDDDDKNTISFKKINNIENDELKVLKWMEKSSDNGCINGKTKLLSLYSDTFNHDYENIDVLNKMIVLGCEIYKNINDDVSNFEHKDQIIDLFCTIFSHHKKKINKNLISIIYNVIESEKFKNDLSINASLVVVFCYFNSKNNFIDVVYDMDFIKSCFWRVSEKYPELIKSFAPMLMFGRYGFEVTEQSKEDAELLLLNALLKSDDPKILYFLGCLYDSVYLPHEVNHDEEKAFDYFLKAAKMGHVDSMFVLGQRYFSNDLYKKRLNFSEAIQFLKKAHENGNDSASLQFAILLLCGVYDSIGTNLDEAYEILMKLALKEDEIGLSASSLLSIFTFNKKKDKDQIIIEDKKEEKSQVDQAIYEIMNELDEEPTETQYEYDVKLSDEEIEDSFSEIIEHEQESIENNYSFVDPVEEHRINQMRKKSLTHDEATEIKQKNIDNDKKVSRKKRNIIDKFQGSLVRKLKYRNVKKLLNVLSRNHQVEMKSSKSSNEKFELNDARLSIHVPDHSESGMLNYGRAKNIKNFIEQGTKQ